VSYERASNASSAESCLISQHSDQTPFTSSFPHYLLFRGPLGPRNLRLVSVVMLKDDERFFLNCDKTKTVCGTLGERPVMAAYVAACDEASFSSTAPQRHRDCSWLTTSLIAEY
jgi:hypothetical protein